MKNRAWRQLLLVLALEGVFSATLEAQSTAPAAVAVPTSAPASAAALEATERFLLRAMHPGREGTALLSVLSMARDPELLPLFDQIARHGPQEIRAAAMLASNILSKDSARLDLDGLLNLPDPALARYALVTIIDTGVITDAQLQTLMQESPESATQAVAGVELLRRTKLPDHAPVMRLWNTRKELVRAGLAIPLLTFGAPAEAAEAQEFLVELAARNDVRASTLQSLIMDMIRKDKCRAADAWVEKLARDPQLDGMVRLNAVATLLTLNHPAGGPLWGQLLEQQTSTIQRIKLALVALEFASQIEPSRLAMLEKTDSRLQISIAALVRVLQSKADAAPAYDALIKQGHPIVLDWAVRYCERAPAATALMIRGSILTMARTVDDKRERDFDRATLASERAWADQSPGSVALIKSGLAHTSPAVVEATLRGILMSNQGGAAPLVEPLWKAWNQGTSAPNDKMANHVALILGRDRAPASMAWLAGMTLGRTTSDVSARLLAGWYHARMTGMSQTLLTKVLRAESTPASQPKAP